MSSTVTKTTGRIERMGVTLDRVNEAAHREREALWAASDARDRERRRRELDALRLEFHVGQAKRLRGTMEDLITHHENEARKLTEGGA
jgi:hypothetical protein